MVVPLASPPPPTGGMTTFEIRHLFEQLESGGALTRDHPRVVVRVDEGRAGPLLNPGEGRFPRFEGGLALGDDRAVARDRRLLHRRRR